MTPELLKAYIDVAFWPIFFLFTLPLTLAFSPIKITTSRKSENVEK